MKTGYMCSTDYNAVQGFFMEEYVYKVEIKKVPYNPNSGSITAIHISQTGMTGCSMFWPPPKAIKKKSRVVKKGKV